jgi:hypothetical protein
MTLENIPEQAETRNEAAAATPPLFAGREWLTVEEAVVLFQHMGLPRTAEAIRSYCRKGKIEASSMEGAKGDQHMVRTESARSFITERKRVLDALAQGLPDQDGTMRKLPVRSKFFRNDAEVVGTPEPAGPPIREAELEAKLKVQDAEIEALRSETRTLEIDKRVREQMLERVDADRQMLLGRVLEMGTEVGQLRERVSRLQLATRARQEERGDGGAAAAFDRPAAPPTMGDNPHPEEFPQAV